LFKPNKSNKDVRIRPFSTIDLAALYDFGRLRGERSRTLHPRALLDTKEILIFLKAKIVGTNKIHGSPFFS